MSRVYLDACTIIYLVEAASPFHSSVVHRLLLYQGDPTSVLIASRLSCLECRIRPIKDNDERLLAIYNAALPMPGDRGRDPDVALGYARDAVHINGAAPSGLRGG